MTRPKIPSKPISGLKPEATDAADAAMPGTSAMPDVMPDVMPAASAQTAAPAAHRPRADMEQLREIASGAGPSLKARAVALLSRREHSRHELARKLSPHVSPDHPNELERILDELERGNWLSDERFARNLAQRRAPRKGTAMVLHELRQHGLADAQLDELRDELRSTEIQRARAVWQKKFGSRPATPAEYARQFRFMASRGFSPDCLRQILGGQSDADDQAL